MRTYCDPYNLEDKEPHDGDDIEFIVRPTNEFTDKVHDITDGWAGYIIERHITPKLKKYYHDNIEPIYNDGIGTLYFDKVKNLIWYSCNFTGEFFNVMERIKEFKISESCEFRVVLIPESYYNTDNEGEPDKFFNCYIYLETLEEGEA